MKITTIIILLRHKLKDEVIKKYIHIFVKLLVGVIILLLGCFVLLFHPSIQTSLAQYATQVIKEECNVEMHIGGVYLKPMSSVVLKDVYAIDFKGDTLFDVEKLEMKIDTFSYRNRSFNISEITLDRLYLDLYIERGEPESIMNLDHFIDSLRTLSSMSPASEKKSLWSFNLQRIKIERSRFLYREAIKDTINFGINWTDIDCRDLKVDLTDFSFSDSINKVRLEHLSVTEKSGLSIKEIQGNAQFTVDNFIMTDAVIALEKSFVDLKKLEYNWTPNNQDWKYFITRMHQYYEIGNSIISFEDLAYFNERLLGMKNVAKCRGVVFNTVDNIEGKDLVIELEDKTLLRGKFKSNGLPDIYNTHFDVDLEQSQIGTRDMENIYLPWMDYWVDLPDPIHHYEVFDFSKIHFDGTILDFDLHAQVEDRDVQGRISFKLKEKENEVLDMQGDYNFPYLNVSKAVNSSSIGRASSKGYYNGYYDGDIHLNLDGYLKDLSLFNSRIDSVSMLVSYDEPDWQVHTQVYDSLVNARIYAQSINEQISSVGDISLGDVAKLFDIDFLEKTSTKLSYTAFSGVDSTSVPYTELLLDSVFVENESSNLCIDSLYFQSWSYSKHENRARIDSDILTAEVYGNYLESNPIVAATRSLIKYLPRSVIKQFKLSSKKDESYSVLYTVNLHDINPLINIIDKSVYIAPNTYIYGEINERKRVGELRLLTKGINYADLSLHNARIDLAAKNRQVSTTVRASRLSYGNSYNLHNVKSSLKLNQDTLWQNLIWNNYTDQTFGGEIATQTFFSTNSKGDFKVDLEMKPGVVILSDTVWKIAPASIGWESDRLKLDSLRIYNQNQEIIFSGELDNKDAHGVRLALNNIELKSWGTLLFDKSLSGVATGTLLYRRPNETNVLLADMSVSNAKFGRDTLGDMTLKSYWDNSRDQVMFAVSNQIEKRQRIQLYGTYHPSNDTIKADLNLDNIYLSDFRNYTDDYIDKYKGKLSGSIKIAGTIIEPEMYGKLFFNDIVFRMKQTNCFYILNDSVQLKNSRIELNDLLIRDKEKGVASISGHYNLLERESNLRLFFDRYMVLNTLADIDNNVFGKLYLSGSVNLKDDVDGPVSLSLNLRPEKDSYLGVPMTLSSQSTKSDFLHFVDLKDEIGTVTNVQKIVVEDNIKLDANIELNENIDVDVIFDPVVGDQLSINGDGDLRITLDNDGVLQMFGNYEIVKGNYLFTLSNLLNKKFELSPGGMISWTGSPFDASIDVNAVYSLKSSLNELLPIDETGDNTKDRGKKVPVECVLSLTDRLVNPNVKFGIEFPSLESQTRSYIESLFSSQDEINKQVFSLLILNNFYRSDQETNQYGEKAGMASITTVTEMVSGQLSRWLSQLSNNFDVGLAYRVGEDEIISDEIEVGLSTNLLNDRITISANGNMDVGNKHTATTGGNNIAGDFDVNVKLNQKGNLKLKGYSHTNEKILYSSTETIQGIGVSYQESFDSFRDLFKKYFRFLYRKRDKEVKSKL